MTDERDAVIEKAKIFWSAHLKRCGGLGGHTHQQVLADFAIEHAAAERGRIAEMEAMLSEAVHIVFRDSTEMHFDEKYVEIREPDGSHTYGDESFIEAYKALKEKI